MHNKDHYSTIALLHQNHPIEEKMRLTTLEQRTNEKINKLTENLKDQFYSKEKKLSISYIHDQR